MRILVVPEQLRSFSAQLQQAASDLRAVSGRVGGALGSLDWEARQKAGVDGQVNGARSRANVLADQAEALAGYLMRKAEMFEEADGQGTNAIQQVFGIALPALPQWMTDLLSVFGFPSQRVAGWLVLGGLLGGVPGLALVSLPVIAGASITGFEPLTPLSKGWSQAQDWGERLWNGIVRREGFKTNEELGPKAEAPHEPTPQPQPTTPTPKTEPSPPPVPEVREIRLLSNDKAGGETNCWEFVRAQRDALGKKMVTGTGTAGNAIAQIGAEDTTFQGMTIYRSIENLPAGAIMMETPDNSVRKVADVGHFSIVEKVDVANNRIYVRESNWGNTYNEGWITIESGMEPIFLD